jgi:hypothetical protein
MSVNDFSLAGNLTAPRELDPEADKKDCLAATA